MSIIAKHVTKAFSNPPTKILHDVNLEIQEGDFVSIVGRSGSGKTTLLYILSTLDNPTEGVVEIDGQEPPKMDEDDLHLWRNKNIGYIFQFHYLLPELNSLENVLLPARKSQTHKEKRELALQLLESVGLQDKIDRYPSQLSGGEQQRVAIARALLMNPKYIFADEPTGNLDSKNGMVVMELLQKINKEKKTTVVLVTHEPDFAAMAKQQITIVDGKIN
jgi:lipoprotein-releasing system ATP-binding protein